MATQEWYVSSEDTIDGKMDEIAAYKIEALYAYDMGATDSGIKDDIYKKAAREWKLDYLYRILTLCVSNLANEPGYGFESVVEFVHWVEDSNGLNVDWL